ncbi:retropepsin-like aspartic protease [Aquabacterium sp. G14]|uniref:retropepsin-like aspartic protease family protein n=1 Tax=Aquabacterium sp. G14 TaxID=3130164 RepID=UPI00309FC8D9
MRHAHSIPQILLGVSLSLCACAAMAQSVAMTGGMGSKALLVINGGQPKALAAGDTHQGVKVISVTPDQAVVDVAGRRQTVTLGGAPVSVGGRGGAGGGTEIVLTAGPGGHFVTQGSINGRGTQFVVDTGATMVSMGAAEARRLGINFETGQRMQAHTANGVTTGYRISLSTLRIQDVEVHNVEAAVMPMGMPYILLGNSFLSRFQMKQENGTMTLKRRF